MESKKVNLIGVVGRISSGKDTVGQMIRYLTSLNTHLSYNEWIKEYDYYGASKWEIKKFADKIKDITCLLTGCTRSQLEDRDFKEQEIGKDWKVYKALYLDQFEQEVYLFATREERKAWIDSLSDSLDCREVWEETLTYRKLMQLLGTECGRNILHPNIWITSLFADYKLTRPSSSLGDLTQGFPNWIITDCRFPNEMQSIKDRGGILIKINKKWDTVKSGNTRIDYIPVPEYQHPSELEMDKWTEWDEVINNDGTLDELLSQVKTIVEKYNL